MSVKDIDILKAILLKEEEEQSLPQGFEDDPMGFILKKYAGLNKVLEYMMTESFREYVDAIFIVAPKPTTFKVVLHNGQYFFLEFMGKAYQATVLGKNYYLKSIGEKERCIRAIARLLRYGNPLKTKGPEGAEQGTRPEGEAGAEGGEAGAEVPEATPEEGGEELKELAILQEIVKKKLSEEDEKYRHTLSVEEISKLRRGKYRGDQIVKYVSEKKPFKLKNGEEKILTFSDESIKKIFADRNYKKLSDTQNIFKDSSGNTYSLGDIIKTKDFGGQPIGASVKHETAARKRLDEQIKKAVKDNDSKPIRIKIGKIEYDGITGVENEPKTPKSDFNLMQGKNPKVFISHKMEGGSKSFVRWGGFKFAYEDPEVIEFIQNIESKVPDKEFKSGYSFSQKIKSDLLKNKIVFGKGFGGKFSKHNVNVVLQGDIDLVKIEGDLYELEVDEYWLNGETPKGEYEPVLEAHYRDKPKKTFGFTNCEAFARTINSIPNTSIKFTSKSSDQVWEPKQPKKSSSDKRRAKISKNNYIEAEPAPPKTTEPTPSKMTEPLPVRKALVFVRRSWVKQHPEYKKDFDENKAYPKDKNFILMNPNSADKFELEKE